MPTQRSLLPTTAPSPESVTCLGQTFPSDAARREHFSGLLAEKLKDPAFRRLEGFPLGSDEALLALSDPPYYTACPNPWLADFVAEWEAAKPKKPAGCHYHREPFAADVSEGRTHPIYNAHSYHTKVPHRAIMRYILHFTAPGDVLMDAFCGSGMAGVAAQLCGKKSEVEELGYRVDEDGNIYNENGLKFSKLGARKIILNDLSPMATFIGYNYTTPVNVDVFSNAASNLLSFLDEDIGWMYKTKHTDGSLHPIDFTVWSEVYTCPSCTQEILFTDEALDEDTNAVRTEFPCPHCSILLNKRNLERVFENSLDPKLGSVWRRVKFKPCLIQYRVGRQKFEKKPDAYDLDVLEKIDAMPWPASLPSNAWPISKMYHGSRIEPKGFNHTHQFFLPRAAIAIGKLFENAKKESDARIRGMLLFFVEQAVWTLSRMNRYRPTGYSQVNQYLSGVYYIAAQHAECSPNYVLNGKSERLKSTFSSLSATEFNCAISSNTADQVNIPENSLDYIFTDPPFGENIPYADLNLLIESMHGVTTNSNPEAIIDSPKGKELSNYRELMVNCLRNYYHALKPGRWITVEFSNSQASVWNAIQSAMQEAGFVVANVSALDKQQRSFRSVTTTTAVKQDLVISAYKPNGGLEDRFKKSGPTVAGVWDFVQTHLKNLPVAKAKGGELEFVTERDPRILFDRVIAFYIAHNLPVPMNSGEFQAGLAQNFETRDGMIYLKEQAAEYDKVRAKMSGLGQMSLFVDDERSAIAWLRQFLTKKPCTYQDIQPEFLKQITGGWKKCETRPELQALLEQNFLRHDGEELVPAQFHAVLSSNRPDLRNKEKNDPALRAEAADRWYVPDANKAADVQKLRDKKLLEEFWAYLPAGYTRPTAGSDKQASLPGLSTPPPRARGRAARKEVRLEVLRVGFQHCSNTGEYSTLLAVAGQLAEGIVEEDELLQMLVDLAVLRSGR